ncbi:MAG: hypothetical protein ACLQEQ_02200 [Nitrososphaerales archaeon]
MFPPLLILLVVSIDAIADMTTTSIGLRMGMPETNRLPRWFFKKLGNARGPIIYTPLEIVVVFGCLSIAYNILLAPWGQGTAASLVLCIAIVLTASVVVNNTTRLLLKWRRLRKAAGLMAPDQDGRG